MSGGTFGRLLQLTTWGESHGEAIGAVLSGMPSGVRLSEADIQPFLDKRKPGASRYTSQRREADRVKILSGIFTGRTTGAPICLLITNTDARSKDYEALAETFRPGHADYTYWVKYGIRDHRGGGRASARETAMRVAAAAIARKIIPKVKLFGAVVAIGEKSTTRRNWKAAAANPLFCPDEKLVDEWGGYLERIRKSGDSVGAIVEVRAKGAEAGLGEPIYGKLDAELAAAMMSIPAVKAVEIGGGFAAASRLGSENADEILGGGNRVRFASNNAGGILGGISNGDEIVVRFAVKPTSSILKPLTTISSKGKPRKVSSKGRHDPCVGIRAVPIGEAMLALVLADYHLLKRAKMRP